MAEVDNQYISEAINNLVPLVGIKKDISYSSLRELFNKRKIKECIKLIANYLGLPIEVNLIYVQPYYGSNNKRNQGFTSQQVVKTDYRGRGVAGITAQVSIPSQLPFYGTTSFVNFPIDVRISENIKEYPNTFMTMMAHELSHILLHSLQYPEKDNEIYTDIASMLLGFNEVMKLGRKTIKTFYMVTNTTIQTTTYGYLSDEQFEFAFNEIKFLYGNFRIKKAELLIQVDKIRRLIKKIRKLCKIFKENFTWISKKLNTIIIEGKDASQFVQMQGFLFQYGDFEKDLLIKEEFLDNIYQKIINKTTYFPNKDDDFNEWKTELSEKFIDNKYYYDFFRENLKVQIKYIKPYPKLLTLVNLIKN